MHSRKCDTVGITRPCVKHNFLVKDVRDLAITLKKAFYIAKTGRPGPVLVDIPKDITNQKCEFEYPKTISMRSYNPVVKGHGGQIKKAVQMLLDAKRPMIYAGGGVILSDAPKNWPKLARRLGYPVTNTLMGLGGFPATDKQWLGMLGMHGTYEANMAMQNCDVLIAVGARFDDRVIGNPAHFAEVPRKIIHIDIDPSSISKRVKVDVPIVGNLPDVLDELQKLLEASAACPMPRRWRPGGSRSTNGAARSRSSTSRARKSSCPSTSSRSSMRLPAAMPSLPPTSASTRCGRRSTTSSTSRAAGSTRAVWEPWVSACPMRWACASPIRRLRWPASPAKASIQMNIQELSTAKQFRLPIKIINLNNRYLGMVRQWQQMFHGNRYAESYVDALPDFVKLAESYGHVGMKIERPADVEPALREAFHQAQERSGLHGLPHRPDSKRVSDGGGGKGLSEMILAEEL
jgi:acetolactate synthase-1/2/3 large subunit